MTKVVTPEKVQSTINLWKRHLLCFWIQEEGSEGTKSSRSPRVIHEWGSSGVGYDCFIDWAQKLQAGASLRGTPQRDSVRDNHRDLIQSTHHVSPPARATSTEIHKTDARTGQDKPPERGQCVLRDDSHHRIRFHHW